MTTQGARTATPNFYLKVKAQVPHASCAAVLFHLFTQSAVQVENEVKELGFKTLSIFRPSVLIRPDDQRLRTQNSRCSITFACADEVFALFCMSWVCCCVNRSRCCRRFAVVAVYTSRLCAGMRQSAWTPSREPWFDCAYRRCVTSFVLQLADALSTSPAGVRLIDGSGACEDVCLSVLCVSNGVHAQMANGKVD